MSENTTHSGWRRSEVPRGRGSSQLTRWFIPVITIFIALAAAWAMENLHERSIERSRAQIVLAALKQHGDHQQLAEFEAISEGELSAAISTEIDENRRGMAQNLNQLEQPARRAGPKPRVSSWRVSSMTTCRAPCGVILDA